MLPDTDHRKKKAMYIFALGVMLTAVVVPSTPPARTVSLGTACTLIWSRCDWRCVIQVDGPVQKKFVNLPAMSDQSMAPFWKDDIPCRLVMYSREKAGDSVHTLNDNVGGVCQLSGCWDLTCLVRRRTLFVATFSTQRNH